MDSDRQRIRAAPWGPSQPHKGIGRKTSGLDKIAIQPRVEFTRHVLKYSRCLLKVYG